MIPDEELLQLRGAEVAGIEGPLWSERLSRPIKSGATQRCESAERTAQLGQRAPRRSLLRRVPRAPQLFPALVWPCSSPLSTTKKEGSTSGSELVIERSHRAASVVTSNRDANEWLRGRSAACAVRRRPAEERRVEARHRRQLLSPARETDPRRPWNAEATVISARSHLTPNSSLAITITAGAQWAVGGPKLLATRWSDRVGKRHLDRVTGNL